MSVTVEVPGIGSVEMTGVGPWRARTNNPSSHDIVDSRGAISCPNVTNTAKGGRGRKTSQGVTFAQASDIAKVVDAANEALAA